MPTPTQNPIRVAVIGGGRWGKNILKTLGANPECFVAYAVTREYQTLFSKTDIDAVVIATPSATHATIALPFIAKKIPVFIEKPMTMSVKDAKRLVLASTTYKTPVFVGHIHLYNPAYIAAKHLLTQSGKVRFIHAEGASNGPFRSDASAMWDWAPHDISMVLDIMKSRPTKVAAWGESIVRPTSNLHDVTYIKLTFKGGQTAIISSSKISPEKRRKLTVVCSKHTVVYDDTAEKKVILYSDASPLVSKKSVEARAPRISYPDYETTLALTAEMHEFLKIVRTKKKPRTDVSNGFEVVTILAAAEKSIQKNGKEIPLGK